MFDSTKCNECGDCFMQCQYIDYSREKAVGEIKALKLGKTADILKDCITCMACNEYCPTGANPYDLIVSLQEQKDIRLVPREIAQGIEETLGNVPNKTIQGDPDKPALSLCVMAHAYPEDITDSRLFDGLTQVSGSDYYSRVVFLHTGMESSVRQHAQQFIDNLTALNKDEIVFMHNDCYVLAACKAAEYGISVPFKPVHIVEYMAGYLKEHKQDIHPLDRNIAYQRPCISRYTPGEDLFLDEFFQLIGAHRVERQHDRENALCCAFGLRETDPERGAHILQRNLNDAKNHAAEAMVFLCPGCYWLTSEACEQAGLGSIFITDLCRMALGEIPFASRPWKPH